MIETFPVEPVEVRRGVCCAYCGDPAVYAVMIVEDCIAVAAGYCCDEPTHWTWLRDGVEEFEREGWTW